MTFPDQFIQTEYPVGSVAPVGPFQPGWNIVADVLQLGREAYAHTLLFYNAITGAASTAGIIWPGLQPGTDVQPAPALIMLQSYTGFSTGWTHIVSTGDAGLFYYNTSDGSAALAKIDVIPPDLASDPPAGSGQHHMVKTWGPGSFRRYWSLVYFDASDRQIHFYDKRDGSMEIGHATADGFTTTSKIPPGVFSPGWTHTAVCTAGNFSPARLFYNADTGSIACLGLYSWAEGPGSIAPGWTHLADRSGTLFYSRYNGAALLVATSHQNHVALRSWPPGSFSVEWTHVVAAGALVFYNSHTGAIDLVT